MGKYLSIIAEIGSVHDGSFGNAKNLIEAAAKSGATAVKFQTHLADDETLADALEPSYFKSEPRMDYFRRTGFNTDQWLELANVCQSNGVEFLSSPFSLEAVDLLEKVGINRYKIPSGEVTNLPLLEKVGKLGKPVLLSSGMSSWQELDAAVEAILDGGAPLTVMQCSSCYPCPPDKVGLNVMLEMKQRYDVPVGYSDHTSGMAACLAAVTLGAVVVEKHFTFSRLMYGSDARHSMEPDKFAELSEALRETRAIISNPVDKSVVTDYTEMKRVFQKSIVAARDLQKDTALTKCDLAFKKPGIGVGAENYRSFLGRRLICDVSKDDFILEEHVTRLKE